MNRPACTRPDPDSGRLRKCLYADPGGCARDGRPPKPNCPNFVLRPPRDRPRAPGRPAIEPNPPRTPEERVERWRAMLAAFQESTGIAVGTPPTFLYETWTDVDDMPPPNADPAVIDQWLQENHDVAIPEIGRFEPDWFNHVPDCEVDDERWNGRDPALLAVLQSEEFSQAARKLPAEGPGAPGYRDLKAAAKAWQALRDTARKVVLGPWAGDEARDLARKGLRGLQAQLKAARLRRASRRLPLPADLYAAARVLADAEVPSLKTVGRPKEGKRDALREIVSVLSAVRCPDGRELTTPELTWLLMLALPDNFRYSNELHLRERVQKARVPLPRVRTKPRP